MKRFAQLHILTSYPPANLNRDDLGRPKTAVMGGTQRLRVSSQSLKRAWRTSDVFEESLSDNLGIRTKDMGRKVYEALINGQSLQSILSGENAENDEKKVDKKKAKEWAVKIAGAFGKNKKSKKEKPDLDLEIEQLAHFSPMEIERIDEFIQKIQNEDNEPEDNDLNLLCKESRAVDIALFGRMLADSPASNIEASTQVSHAISTHEVAIEEDYFSAVDDLNEGKEDMGAGHIGIREFGSGLFYLYACIDRNLFLENLEEDQELASKALQAFVETVATVAPNGMQNSFGSRAYASFILAEKGDQQPRNLSTAFLRAVDKTGNDSDFLKSSIEALTSTKKKFDKVYGDCADEVELINVPEGDGELEKIKTFVGNLDD